MTQVTKFDIPTTDIVQTVSFSPYEWSNDLFAYGTAHHVIIDRCKILNTEVSSSLFRTINNVISTFRN